MTFFYNLIFFYVPYRLHMGNGYLTFSKCVLLIFANLATVLFIYSIVEDLSFRFSDYSRGTVKFFGLLAMAPFAVFYLINNERYKRKFKEFDNMKEFEKKEWNWYANIYIYGSILLVILIPLTYSILLNTR